MFFQRSFRNKKEHRSQIWQNFPIITFSAVFLGLSHRSGHRVKSSEVTNKKLCHNYSLKRVFFLNVLCYLVLNLLSALYLWAKVRSMSWPPHLTLSQWKYFCFEILYFHSKCIRRFIDRVRLCGHVKLSSLNPAGYLEFPDRTVEVRTCATSSSWRGLWPRKSAHSIGSD